MGGNIDKLSGSGNESEVNKDSFKCIDTILNGEYFKFLKVRMKKNSKNYIMKQIIKSRLIDNTILTLLLNERQFLSKIHHPFIVNMHYSFQDEECLYLIYDYLSGEDLGYIIEKRRLFNENQIKFFVSCALLALEYCKHNNIIHCNGNPDSFMFTEYGYIKLHDFSLAQIYNINNKINNVYAYGLEYTPPEVLCGLNPIKSNDLFSIGVICFEMMNGYKPYEGESLIDIRNQMMIKEVILKEQEHNLWSHECIDFINRLLKRKPHLRLGYKEVKNHSWFADVNWDKLYNQEILSPFISQRNSPPIGNNSNKKIKRLYNITNQKDSQSNKNIQSTYSNFLYFSRTVMDREDKLLGYTHSYFNFHRKLYKKCAKANGKEAKCETNSISQNSLLSKGGNI